MTTPSWESLKPLQSGNESDVEVALVLPLLGLLGYRTDDIASKHPVIFQEGRKGRHNEADFAIFNGRGRSRDDALLVVEAKRPGESADAGAAQAHSYAANLGAPLFLLLDGQRLVVWQVQVSGESLIVVNDHLSNLLTLRPDLEALLGRDALVSYKKSLRRKPAIEFGFDTSAYISAELERFSGHSSIDRRLSIGNTSIVNSRDLPKTFRDGFIVAAPSGYGKTTLGHSLACTQFTNHTPAARLPVHVWLPDVVRSQSSLLEFGAERIRVHCPQISFAVLLEIARKSGVFIIGDGLDRLSLEELEVLARDIRNLRRDMKLVGIALFTRSIAPLEVELPLLTLKEFDEDEQQAVVLQRLGDRNALTFWHLLPTSFRSLVAVPLILDRLLQSYVASRTVPSKLPDLFESWLTDIWGHAHANSSVRRNRLRTALTRIAWAGRERPQSPAGALAALADARLDEELFDELAQLAAINVTTYSVELPHEALSDYLRACFILDDDARLANALPTLHGSSNSWLPVLLIALTSDDLRQASIWESIANCSLFTLLDSIRFRPDLSRANLSRAAEPVGRQLLEEFAWSFDKCLAKFSALRANAISALTRCPVAQEGGFVLTGMLSQDKEVLDWAIEASSSSVINIGPVEFGTRVRQAIWLHRSGMRTDSGRLIGAKQAFEALSLALQSRRVRGRGLFVEERLLSRLAYLRTRISGLGGPIEYDLREVERLLEPHRDAEVSLDRERGYPVSEVIDDAQTMRIANPKLRAWWGADLSPEGTPLNNEAAARLFNEKYLRVLHIYREICEESLSEHASSLSMYRAGPIRWRVQWQDGSAASTHWRPVADWSAAGAELVEKVDWTVNDGTLVAELQRLGRYVGGSLRLGRWSMRASFDRHHGYKAIEGETAVLGEVFEWLESDLRALFARLPQREGAG